MEQTFFRVIDLFPMPIEVFRPDGVCAFVNRAFMSLFGPGDPGSLVDSFNALKDSRSHLAPGRDEHVRRIFSGEVLTLDDVRVKFSDVFRRYAEGDVLERKVLYQDLIGFPVRDRAGEIIYIVFVFKVRQIYTEQNKVLTLVQLLDERWDEPFEIEQLAEAAGYSAQTVTRLFKKHLGRTPFAYYNDIRLSRFINALEKQPTVTEASMASGIDYNSTLARRFKEETGMTPAQYIEASRVRGTRNQSRPTLQADWRRPLTDEQVYRVVEQFPMPIQIYRTDGSLVYANEAVLELWNLDSLGRAFESYNLRDDVFVNETFQMRDEIERMFAGEIVLVPDKRVPLEQFYDWYSKRNEVYDIEALYTDILNFPLRLDKERMTHVVSVFYTSRIYRGNPYVVKAREYLETNWFAPFSGEQVAAAVHLSIYHLSRLFKQHTGKTLLRYYQEVKVRHIKEALLDPDLSISEAFRACGVAYQSNHTRIFREIAGMTPSEFRSRW